VSRSVIHDDPVDLRKLNPNIYTSKNSSPAKSFLPRELNQVDILDHRADDDYSLKTSKTRNARSRGGEQGDLRKERVPASEKVRSRSKHDG
jgi:hypothetical protein